MTDPTLNKYNCFLEIVSRVNALRYMVGVDLELLAARTLVAYDIPSTDWLSDFSYRYVAECTKHRHDKAFKPTRLAHTLIANCILGKAKRICG